jgi:hypothetical protein
VFKYSHDSPRVVLLLPETDDHFPQAAYFLVAATVSRVTSRGIRYLHLKSFIGWLEDILIYLDGRERGVCKLLQRPYHTID